MSYLPDIDVVHGKTTARCSVCEVQLQRKISLHYVPLEWETMEFELNAKEERKIHLDRKWKKRLEAQRVLDVL